MPANTLGATTAASSFRFAGLASEILAMRPSMPSFFGARRVAYCVPRACLTRRTTERHHHAIEVSPELLRIDGGQTPDRIMDLALADSRRLRERGVRAFGRQCQLERDGNVLGLQGRHWSTTLLPV